MWKKPVLWCAVAAAAAVAVLVAYREGTDFQAGAAVGRPSLQAVFGETTSLDTGLVIIDRITEGMSISLLNPTDRVLTVEKVETSCGCLGAELRPACIEPGKTGEIVARPVLSGSRGQRAIRLTLHSSTHGVWELTLSGLFMREYHWEPGEVAFHGLDAGEERTAHAILYLPRIDKDPPQLQLRLDPPESLHVLQWGLVATEQHPQALIDQFELALTVRAREAEPHAAGRVYARDSDKVRAELPVRWSVREPVSVFPSMVGFVGKAGQKRTVFVQSNDGASFAISEADTDARWVRASVNDSKASCRQQVQVELLGDAAVTGKEAVRATLRLYLDHPKRQFVEVTLSWLP